MPITRQQLQSGLTMVFAVSEAIREAKEIPSGTLYAALMSKGITMEGYESMLRILTGAGLISIGSNHLIKWIGPNQIR